MSSTGLTTFPSIPIHLINSATLEESHYCVVLVSSACGEGEGYTVKGKSCEKYIGEEYATVE